MRPRRHIPILALAISVAGATTLHAQDQMRVMPSSRATTEVTLALVDSAANAAAGPLTIKIDYGQPHLRGRVLHTDSLVPYDRPWRTGANAATTLTTDVDLVIGGATVPKGTYVLQTLPALGGWKLLVQNEPAPGQSDTPGPATDVARIDLRRTELSSPLESLTIWLIPSPGPGNPRGQLVLAWGSSALATDWSVK